MEEELKDSVIDEQDYLEALQVVYNTLNAGHQATGAFTLLDCKNIKASYVYLSNIANKQFEQNTATAFSTLFKSMEVLQAKGVFSIDTAVDILSRLELISARLESWRK